MASEVSSDSSTGLFGTSVTLEFLEKKLEEVLDTSAKFGPNVSTEQFGFGQGFLSVMVRLKPDWQGEKLKELPTSLVVKIPSSVTMKAISKQTNMEEKFKDSGMTLKMDEAMKNFDDSLIIAQASEDSFYKMIKDDKLKLHVPKCYYTQRYGDSGENGILIMEDLGDTAATKPIYDGLSVESVKEILDNLAELHAYSLLHDQWLSNPDLNMSFVKLQKQLCGGNIDQYLSMVNGNIGMLKKDYPAMFDPLVDRFIEGCKGLDFGETDTMHEKLRIPPVLTHGDLWMNNIMWKKAKDGKNITDHLAAIVDWQLVHPGCVGEDFVRLLCSSVEPNIRREHLDEFMSHYHASLKTKLGREPPFTVAQIVEAYKLLFREGLIMILPSFAGFIQAELGMMGIENVEQRKQAVLNRAKCLLEDLYALEDELGL